MRDAELSDIEEETDDQGTSAPGKENRDPKPRNKKVKASKSFMIENFSYKVKTTSDASSADDGVPISILKALHLDRERARSTSGSTDTNGGGCRLSGASYQPPDVESEISEYSHYDTQSPTKPGRGQEPSSPTTVLAHSQHDSDDSYTKKKKVHWFEQIAKPTTTDSNASDSAYFSKYPSDISMVSNGSGRVRRSPADYCTGSPPVHEGETVAGDLRHDVRKQEKASARRPESRNKGFGQDLPTESTFGQSTYNPDSGMASHNRDSTESGQSPSTPPTPPEAHIHAPAGLVDHAAGAGYEKPFHSWESSPEIPNFSRPCQSPARERTSLNFSRPSLSPRKQRSKVSYKPDPFYHPGYGARPGYTQEYCTYQSAARFSDSTQQREFSGFVPVDVEPAMYGDQDGHHGSPVQHGDWPPRGCPAYNDYDTLPEDNDCGWYSSSDNDDACSSSPEVTGFAAFDFSGFGAASSEVPESIAPESETFVRRSKPTQSTPKRHSWRLYDDGENGAGSVPNTQDYQWKKDGRTTVHRSGGEKMPNSGKTVQILSIREMRSDEELTVSEGESYLDPQDCHVRVLTDAADYEDTSEIDTVIADGKTTKYICAA